MKTIKPVLKMSQNDEKDLNKNKDKNADKNYFLNNYKNMDDNLALFYVGELYNTKNIKLQLKEIVEKRNELKNKIEKEKLLRIKQKLNTNSFTIRKIRFRIMRINEKNKENSKENLNFINPNLTKTESKNRSESKIFFSATNKSKKYDIINYPKDVVELINKI